LVWLDLNGKKLAGETPPRLGWPPGANYFLSRCLELILHDRISLEFLEIYSKCFFFFFVHGRGEENKGSPYVDEQKVNGIYGVARTLG